MTLSASEIAVLEARPRLTTDEHFACFEHYEARFAAETDPRSRIKLAKALGHHAAEAAPAFKGDTGVLERLVRGVEAAARVHTFPQSLRAAAAKIRKAIAQARGTPIVVVDQAKGRLEVEGGALALADLQQLDRVTREPGELAQTQAGEIAWVFAGGDGRIAVAVRHVSGGEPLLSDTEWLRLDGAAALAVIEVPTGRLAAMTPGSEARVLLAVPPGRYAVRCYVSGGKYTWVATPTAAPLGTQVTEIETLEPG